MSLELRLKLIDSSLFCIKSFTESNDIAGGCKMQTGNDFKVHLSNLFRARFPIVYIETWEENRIIDMLLEISSSEEFIKTPRKLYSWSISTGLYSYADGKIVDNLSKDLESCLTYFESIDENVILILKDIHTYFNGNFPDRNIVRRMRDAAEFLKVSDKKKNIVITSPILSIPVELQKDITVAELPLPSKSEIRDVLDFVIETNAPYCNIDLSEEDKELIAKTAQGLTLNEFENALSRALVERKELTINELDIIVSEKCQVIKKTGILEFINADISIDEVGGLENLKKWLQKRNKSWSDKATKDYNLPSPKGVLITGVPGCGKSLTAKAMSSLWKLPLLRLDVGKIFNKWIGNSEENIRIAIQTAEAVAPSILWIDEIEKGFGDAGDNDGGTTSRIFGTFLTWLQEKKKPVFVVATANNISKLPPELLRKGRFDEIFFVDLPTKTERNIIFKLHLEKRLKGSVSEGKFNVTESLLEKLSDMTEGFVGAEIEEIVISALFEAFSENRTLQENDLIKAIKNTVPLSTTQYEQILVIRAWATERAVAATAVVDLDGYAKEALNKKESVKNADNIVHFRGGRNIDV